MADGAQTPSGWRTWVREPLVVQLLTDALPLCLGLYVSLQVLIAFAGRLSYPYDLEWMEGGMLAHAWRIQRWLPVYVEPNPDWIPYIYPPGYPALLAALSTVTGLSMGLGRAVSVFGTLASCAALVFAGWRLGPSRGDPRAGALSGGLAAMVFLAAYPDTGAFYDLVRPDALATGLLAWSLVLGIDRNPRLRVLAAVLLAAAFAVKHNMAAYGLPMALGIWLRFGWRQALVFGAVSAGPALVYTGVLQLASGGHFLTTILDVPRAHPMVVGRFFPATVEELGKAMGLVVVGTSAAFVALTAWQARRVRGWAGLGGVSMLAVVAAAVAVKAGHDLPPAPRMPQPGWWSETAAWASLGLAVGAVVAYLAVCQLGMGPRRRDDEGRWVYGVGVCAMAFFTAGMMRAHHGGFLNVYIPMHWVLCLGLTMGLAVTRAVWPTGVGAVLGAVVVAGHLYGKADFDPVRYVPTAEDVAAGNAFVEALHECDGPVLSPFNPWLPVYAGHAPSFHLIALWDIDHKDGPYHGNVRSIQEAAASRYWGCVVGGSGRKLGHGIQRAYSPWKRPPIPNLGRRRPGGVPPPFMPRTGWRVHPAVILIPKRIQAPD
jgi:hypothetical protein